MELDLIIKAKNIRVDHAGRDILDIEELELTAYDRIGLIGRNGSGKTTLLNILSGVKEVPGSEVKRFGEISYLPQLERGKESSGGSFDPALRSRLGIAHLEEATMSGGEETRRKIAKALSQQVHGLFADEPTCHLDREGVDFLINQLKVYRGAFLIVSHDRYFLDETVDKIWELKDGKIIVYWGGYSDYITAKDAERKRAAEEYIRVTQEKERLERSIQEKQAQANKIEKKQKGASRKKANESTGRLGHQKTVGTKQKKLHHAARNMEHRKDSLSTVKPPEEMRRIHFRQSEALALHNKFPVAGSGVSLSFGERVIFEDAAFVIPLGSKVALTGGNGSGKTTLLKLILEGGPGLTISPKAVFGYLSQSDYQLVCGQSVISYMQEESAYQVSEIRAILASLGFNPEDVRKDLGVLSGGEIVKLKLARVLLGRYNILLMDEPGNYLDIYSIEALESMMQDYAGTIIFVSHDRRFIDKVADVVYEIRDHKIHRVR